MQYETIVSVDKAGILEYWTGAKNDYKFPAKIVSFESKLDTGILFIFVFVLSPKFQSKSNLLFIYRR